MRGHDESVPGDAPGKWRTSDMNVDAHKSMISPPAARGMRVGVPFAAPFSLLGELLLRSPWPFRGA